MLKYISRYLFILTLLSSLQAEETVTTTEKNVTVKESDKDLKEESVVTNHTMHVGGKELSYKAIAGNLLLKNNEQNQPKASIFYVAYIKDDVNNNSERPLLFCFNGGPGSSSVWLHMGIFGPKRVLLSEDGESVPPYKIVDNEYSILDLADLVFIDPVSTGYSRAVSGEDAKQFHGVEEDIASVGEFVRQFITRYERWDSPKLLAGESYGTTRAAGLAGYLHDEYNIYLNGVVLISSVLNFQTIQDSDKGNDLPYPLFLPTYTATALYHKMLSDDLQNDPKKTLEDVKKFALTDYTVALMQGSSLSKEEKEKIEEKLALYTGLNRDFINRSDIRIYPSRFSSELLKSKRLAVGRFDTRVVGPSLDPSCDYNGYDPSFDGIAGAFTAAFNQYVRKDLKVKEDREYKIIANINSKWNYGSAKNQFLNMSTNLHDVMTKNEALRVFVGSGYYDMATPFFATDYTFTHLRLTPDLQKHVSHYYYDGGHMMYTQLASLIKMKNDLKDWMQTLQEPTSALKK